ncbi:hypothetical protein Golob_011782 [Gossypium lobatum]|uniref:Uncharacterized protein n=1 Tax=Gossypium lobatum TaxID=34289 RepID=A0A7J8MQU0_9ROSI|nr:hypothetical protein [Gossypium lobatum]
MGKLLLFFVQLLMVEAIFLISTLFLLLQTPLLPTSKP